MFSVKTATVDHAEMLGDILVRSARFAYADIGSPEYLESLDPVAEANRFANKLKNPMSNHRILIAEEDHNALGFAEIEKSTIDAPGPNCGLLHLMFFVPESLGRGLGPVLHDAVLETFREWGCTHARLTFVRGNARAEAFYLRNGWMSSGELIAFNDHGRTLTDVVMRRSFE
jgi:GNAT superfamily N-acetyltransferase